LPWLAAHCTVSERTAQAYMRLARMWAELAAANPQRAADLSLREALMLLSSPAQLEAGDDPAATLDPEILTAEAEIVAGEDEADAMRWAQAARVVTLIDAGMTQRELAQHWIDARTGEPYAPSHVSRTVRAFRAWNDHTPRPCFRDAYEAITKRRPMAALMDD
jgi:hypothetical protein